MNKIINYLRGNDRVQNQFALYYLLDYGKKNLLDEEFVSKLKKDIEEKNDKHSIISNSFAKESVDIAVDMAKLSHQDIYEFIYQELKEQKRQERRR